MPLDKVDDADGVAEFLADLLDIRAGGLGQKFTSSTRDWFASGWLAISSKILLRILKESFVAKRCLAAFLRWCKVGYSSGSLEVHI